LEHLFSKILLDKELANQEEEAMEGVSLNIEHGKLFYFLNYL
jgi:hypothetical protein